MIGTTRPLILIATLMRSFALPIGAAIALWRRRRWRSEQERIRTTS